MRTLLLVFIVTVTSAVNASMINLSKRGSILSIPQNEVEAIISKNGTYARIVDLKEGFESFQGAFVIGNQVNLDLKNPNFEVNEVLLKNGDKLQLKMARVIGGDSGGGGKQPPFNLSERTYMTFDYPISCMNVISSFLGGDMGGGGTASGGTGHGGLTA